jgi:hypothetical protein
MSSPTGAMMPDYLERAQKQLADLLLRKILSPETSDAERAFHASQFVKPNFKVYPERPPVVGVGVGQTDNGIPRIELLTTVPDEALTIPNLMFSLQLQSMPYHVTRTGRIRACARPAQGGDSIGHPNGITGTLGALVENKNHQRFILSCNHVIADVNRGKKGVDDIWQPGRKDSGKAKDKIGTLHDFKPLNLGGVVSNDIDAAVCTATPAASALAGIRTLGPISGIDTNPPLRIKVRKEGRTTNVTDGVLRMKKLSMIVRYADGSDALFDDQFGIIGTSTKTYFSEQGDSGAIVMDDSNRAVGLLIADSDGVDVSYANPIKPVLDYFGVTLC